MRKHLATRPTAEFKQEAVRIALTSELTRRQIASDLGIGFSTLGKWIRQSRDDEMISVPQQDLFKEVERLRKENQRLKEERDILKKPQCSSRPVCDCCAFTCRVTEQRK